MDRFLLLAASAETTKNLSIFDPVSPAAESIRILSVLVFAITGFIFLVVEGVLFYCVFRFRRRAATASTEPAEPPQVYGSQPIEIAWTAAPTLVVFILVLVVTRTLWEVNKDTPKPQENDNTLFVTVVGRQWWWEFNYENYNGKKLGFATANELHVPVSDDDTPRRVFLALKSADVCHSFWVPRLAGKTDLIPGRVNSLWFQTKEAGHYVGQCAEYCGTQHAKMLLNVFVDSPGDFDTWLENQERPADSKASEGKKKFLAQSCLNCHRVRPLSAQSFPQGAAWGTYAPDLTHLMSRQTLASGMIPNSPDGKDLRAWVDNPQEIKPGCLMPAFGLSKKDRDLIVDYLLTLH